MFSRYATFDWNRARAFLATVEEGSLSAAARALNLTQPTISRQISALEAELGVPLFERVGRKMTPTMSGLRLVEELRVMGEAANQVSLKAAGQAKRVTGTVRISASVSAAGFLLPPALLTLRHFQPGIKIDLVVSTDQKDLRLREADIAMRHVEPTEPELVSSKVTAERVRFRLYATADYLNRAGNPLSKEDLSRVDFVDFEPSDRLRRRLNQLGLELQPENFKVVADDWMVSRELVKQGLGIGLLAEAVGDDDPLLERVPVDLPVISEDTWITVHRELEMTPRVHAVFNVLCKELC